MTPSGITRALAVGAMVVALVSRGDAAAAPPASGLAVWSGNHPGFGRIVIDTNNQIPYHLDQEGDHVVVHLADGVTLAHPPSPPRNVTTIRTDGSTVDLTLSHGARLRAVRMSGRVVLDVMDPTKDKSAAPNAGPGANVSTPAPKSPASLSRASSPEPGGRSVADPAAAPANAAAANPVPFAAKPRPPPSVAKAPQGQNPSGQNPPGQTGWDAAQETPPGRDVLPENDGPVGLMARLVALPNDVDGSAFRVPFDATTGAAAFRGGNNTYVVFDERRPVDMSALRNDPLFAAATVRLLPNGTMFRIPLPPTRTIALTPMAQGWRIAALTTPLKQQPIAMSYVDGHLSLAAEQSGDVVSLADPESGATLLVGTQHHPGQGVAAVRRSSEFILRPTLQGVVVEPLSDAISMQRVPTGFRLSGGPAGLLLSPRTGMSDALMDAAHLTRLFDFSAMPTEALLRLWVQQITAAATSPPLQRGRKNRLAAESFIALGLGAEAESLLHMAAEQDPREAASAKTGALTAIAALLAGRTDEADALRDPRLDGTDEIALWRAIRQAMRDDGSPGAASVFAATAPLVFQYPKAIREHILPLIIETMIKGGETTSAKRLLDQDKDDPRLAYARAMMQQTEGHTEQALSMLDALSNGHDQFDRARAAVRAVELRLSAHKLTKAHAADALDKLLYAWRGDARELTLRERVAELRGQTGAWREALAILRQAEVDFPDQATPIHDRLKDMFAAMIRDPNQQKVSPIDFVALVDENADLMPNGGDDDGTVRRMLADRLLALDLPVRAKPLLRKLMQSAKSDVAKARFGVSLATLDARAGDDAGAQAILDQSAGQDLPPELVEQRTILRAESVAHQGNPAAAAAMLAPLRSDHAIRARAQILENASDWAGAAQAWSDCVALTVPESGGLNEAQTQTVLRLATATARAANDPGLADLRAKYAGRIGAGPLGDMFRLLTAKPIKTTADIKRSKQEVNLAAALPADLKALQPAPAAR